MKLNRSNLNIPKELPVRILQFGGGNFLRAFVDWMVQILNEETNFNSGVVLVKPTENGNYSALRQQDGLYTVVLDGVHAGKLLEKTKLVTCIQKVINPYEYWEDYLKLSENEDLRFIVSNTTEAGIKTNPKDAVTDCPPIEFPAKLTLWLHRRYIHFNGASDKGLILLPTELIQENGKSLQNHIITYAQQWELESGFISWIKTANYFCNTLVDRIVSGYPKDRAEKLCENLGYQDQLLVSGEYYHSWVIQANTKVQEELPFSQTKLNVQFVEELRPYRELKVKILNGAHTAMVPIGYLAGLRLVNEVMQDTVVSTFIESLLRQECTVALDFPAAYVQSYINDVLDRFRNPILQHQLIDIALNSTSKFVIRLLPTLNLYLKLELELPKRIVFSLSALLCFYKGDNDGEPIAIKDNVEVLDFFHEQWIRFETKAITLDRLTKTLLGNRAIWNQDLNKVHGLTNLVATYMEAILNVGIRQAITENKLM